MFITIFNLLCSIYDRPIRSNRLEDNCWWYIARHLRYGITEVLKFCPKSPMLDFMVNHSYFFILVTWISLIIIWIFGGIHENVTRKNRNFGGIHGRQKKKIETTWYPGWALFGVGGISSRRPVVGAKPPKIQTIIHEYQVTKIKKYERFTMKSNIGDFRQNFSTSNLQYIKCEFT